MSDNMNPISFKRMLQWIFSEYRDHQSIFGIPLTKLYRKRNSHHTKFFGESLGTPIGPAAGPHTQMTQNIIASYLAGGRFFELKTVQILDELKLPKPCIAAQDEGYNTEWSTELSISGAFAEYVKAWIILHILQKEILQLDERDFVFNMSVGYNMEGILSPQVDAFIEGLKDASGTELFHVCKGILLDAVDQFAWVDRNYIESISPHICSSVTLSTMHGCPPSEIKAICRYLIQDKKLNTFVKMNPTLLGYSYVHEVLDQMGYQYVKLKEESFSHDLQYTDGVTMLKDLRVVADSCGKGFGVKVANTLPVQVTRQELPGEEMYMSGRSLYPLTVNLAYKLASEFGGDLVISYAGGADYFSAAKIYEAGIRPITMATTLLKPGGYYRLHQIAVMFESLEGDIDGKGGIDLGRLSELASSAFTDLNYIKYKRTVGSRKISDALPLTDCFVAPCTKGCPVGQDVPEYIRLVGEEKYEQALAVILDKNPLPFITGTICGNRCLTKCTRLDYDDAVQIREVKLLAAEKGWRPFLNTVCPSNYGHAAGVGIIGSGPSGLAAAYFLARAGIGVTVMDKQINAGGTIARVIPDFRISRDVVELDLELIRRMGVRFQLGIGNDLTIEELRARGFNYIYLAIGAGKSKPATVTGDSHRIMSAISFLESYKKDKSALVMGRNVAVVGGGNTAVDAARAALRIRGVERVYMVYRRTREVIPALREELELAIAEGVLFKELLLPVELNQGVLHCLKTSGEFDATGRRGPIDMTGEYEDIPADYVLSAIGELVDTDYLRHIGLQVDEYGRAKVDPTTLETNLPNVFIGGDALSGPGTVVEAIADGKKVASVIIARENRADSELVLPNPTLGVVRGGSDICAKKGVLMAKGPLEAEPVRCLDCGYQCNICTEVCPNRANVPIEVAVGNFRDVSQILHVDGLCNQCGNCATFCPYSGAPYKDKLTLYWSEDEFSSSGNTGFVLVEGGAEPEFRVRVNGREVRTKFSVTGEAPALPGHISSLIWAVVQEYSYLFQS